MKLPRINYDPGSALDFYEEGLSALGALCERTWHDRLEIIAEGRAAALWNADGSLHSGELYFAPADTSAARDASKETFPGCPLTFRLAETLRPTPLPLERLVLADEGQGQLPSPSVAEKLWRAQFADTTRWKPTGAFEADYHFSLVVLLRCEIQAMDQHWSLRRLAIALPGGTPDEGLAHDIVFAKPDTESAAPIAWPKPDPAQWSALVSRALEAELAGELAGIQARQARRLQRELDRIDDYFHNYAAELESREKRSSSERAKVKHAERLAAAKTEHARRRSDQVHRHEIHVCPHIDALLLVAEPAWRVILDIERSHHPQRVEARLVPRLRRWEVISPR